MQAHIPEGKRNRVNCCSSMTQIWRVKAYFMLDMSTRKSNQISGTASETSANRNRTHNQQGRNSTPVPVGVDCGHDREGSRMDTVDTRGKRVSEH